MNFLLQIFHGLDRLRCFLTRPLTLGVRVLLVRDQQVLLVKHAYAPYCWYIPGGGVKKGETLEQAMRREAAEEAGATLGDVHLFGVYTTFSDYKSDHVVVFVCEDFEAYGRKSVEIEAFGWFALDALPEGVSAGSQRRIEEYACGKTASVVGMW